MTSGLRPAGQEPASCSVWGELGEELPRQRARAASIEAGPFLNLGKKIRCLGLGEQGRSGADHTGFVVRAEEFGDTVEVLGDE